MKTGGGIKHSTLCLSFSPTALSLKTCVSNDASQSFQLLPSGLMWHKGSERCLAPSSLSPGQLHLVECRGEAEDHAPLDLTWRFTVVPVT